MAGKFEIYKGGGKTGGYRRRLKSRNGEIVASGEAYETKAGAKKGIDAVQRAAAGAKVEDLTSPRRPTKTTPTPTRLALEPPHRHRLDHAAHRLTANTPTDDKHLENRRQ
jgi:uncharacterized protein